MSATIENQTPYYISYCFSYQAALNNVREFGVVRPRSSKRISQLTLPSHIYVKYEHQSQDDTRHRADLHRSYNGIHHPTFYIREYGADRSLLQLTSNRGGDSPTCPNYGKQEEDRIEMQRRRLQEEENRRRQQQIERERRIQEEIEKESKALEEKQVQFNKKLEMRRNRNIQRQKETHILRHVVEDDALPIQITEVTYIYIHIQYIDGAPSQLGCYQVR
ncbi:uncharacterized protein LOC120945876 [Rana temporaria]|uniref:uncharacterized protein LOC120945876 n=1 Tax=Rana temporaria TaxID=8407 RepID=UPI001AAD1947|nr:uncharacterized protein LOC120945876 [Rana temporaria]